MGKSIVQQNKEDVKNKAKQEKQNMKKFDWKTIVTVTITLALVASHIAALLGGINYQKSQSEQVKAEAASIVKSVKVDVSKQ